MDTKMATKFFTTDQDFRYSDDKGLKFERNFTVEGTNPFEMFAYDLRSSIIREPNGKIVFEMNEVEVPKFWSQVATDILAQKYFRKAGVPQYNSNGALQLNDDGTPKLGPENSIKQVAHRLAGTWRYWGEKYGYFASPTDAQVFYEELVYMIINQMVAPNSPQWFNTGLFWAYGINGPAQGHHYVDPDSGVLTRSTDAYTHPQPHACGRYDTKLFVEEGLVNLGQIVEENRTGIKIFDGENFVKVVAVKNNGVKKIYRATLRNGNYIDFTDDHLVLCSERRIKDGGEYGWKELKDVLGNKVKQCSLNFDEDIERAEQKKIEKAELAGWVVGDGYYGKYGRNKKTTLFGVITINDDEFTKVAGIFKSLFGSYTVSVRKSVSDFYRIVNFNSNNVDGFVEEYELNQYCSQARVPEIIEKSGKAEKAAFLRGLFQADGCVRVRKDEDRNCGDIVLTSISERLLHEVQILLLGLGIYSNITPNSEKRENRHESYQLSISYYSERIKYEKLIGFVSEEKRVKMERLNSVVDGKHKNNMSEETVLSIDFVAEEEVYDIQTESGKFCANGVVVHNCFIQSVKDDLVNEGGIMDLWVREARLFKYGSGTGTNFSGLRGTKEALAGGGTSSGLMSWLRIGDRAAGAIKSGGTTRRAAKMVILNVDHPDIEEFVVWKVNEEKKVAALIAAGYDSAYESEAYQTVSGQNSNNSVRLTQAFLEAVQNDSSWNLLRRTDGKVAKTIQAKKLWEQIIFATWACADPGVQLDTTINDWHTCPQSGRINASNPCSEYMFLDDTACNLASINLAKFFDANALLFNVSGFKYTARLWTMVLEISILMAQYPSAPIAEGSYNFRSLGLGYANIGQLLMTAGIPYDSAQAMAFAGSVTSLMTAVSYVTSAEMARNLGAFAKFELNRADMLRVVRNHRRATNNVVTEEYETLSVKPLGIDQKIAPAYILNAAKEEWDRALALGEIFGFRNAQTTLLAPTGTIGLLMDCATTGVEPDFALVKFKKLAGGGYFKIVNETIPAALRTLGYNESQIDEIIKFMKGHGTFVGAPVINATTLESKGFKAEEIEKIEKGAESTFELAFLFNPWTLGEECMKRLGFGDKYKNKDFNLLNELGFTTDEIEKANEYVCGAMTVESAPYLKPEHYAVFDTANKNGKKGVRYIHYLGHIRMMAAVQPFLSGAISKTINMPHEATMDDIDIAYRTSWQMGLKAVAIYRDGCKLSQPLLAKSQTKAVEKKEGTAAELKPLSNTAVKVSPVESGVKQYMLYWDDGNGGVEQKISENNIQENYAHDGTSQGGKIYLHGEQRVLPYKRSGVTIKSKVAGQKVFLRTGEYPDGRLGEVFIDMYREGASFRSMLNLFAISVSIGLQYGVPLEEYVDKFTFTRFEPSGMTDHPNVKFCTSVADYVFRVLGMEYLGRTDFVQVKPNGIQKHRAEKMALSTDDGQKTINFAAKENKTEGKIVQAGKTSVKPADADAVGKQLSGMMGDAPPCPTCGHITIRNGSCYKCLNCGSTTGCS